MRNDIRLAVRALWKDPGYAVTAILTLAVCIGANAAVFTIVNTVLLKPLPVPDADRIVLMYNAYPNAANTLPPAFSSAPDYFDRRRETTVYDELAMYNVANFTMDVGGTPEMIRGMAATPSLFRLLQVPPFRGRLFDDSEGEVGHEQVVILSHGLWQQAFGAAEIVGQTIRMSGRPFTVVGVMPPVFQFADPDARFWIPIAFTDQQRSDDARHSNNWINIGRLKPGATIEQAQAQIDALNAANMDRFPQWREILTNAGFYTRAERLQDMLVRSIRETLYLLWGGALVVLLIGWLNIVNIALARSRGRAKELTTRVTLGASRLRVGRQLAIEGVTITTAGGIAGTLVGLAMLRGLRAIGLERIPRASEIQMDITVLGTIAAVSLVAGIVIGLIPLLHLPTVRLHDVLREETRSGTGGRRTRAVRRGLVVAEVGFALVLLVASGLLMTSFRQLVGVNPGFNASNIVTAGIGIPRARYPEDEDVRRFTERALDAVRAVPGVASAGATNFIPLGGNSSGSVIFAEGYQMQPGESLLSPYDMSVTPGYFETMGTPLVQGRYFTDRDDVLSEPVIIIDEWLAHRFWPNADPIGKRMYNPDNPRDLFEVNEQTRWLTVVGVVRTVQLVDVARPANVGAYYFPAAQGAPRALTLAVKTSADLEGVLRNVRAAVQRLDPEMPLADIRPMTEYVSRSLMPRRAAMLLATWFGVVSLLLAAIGIYGVLSYLVSQRAREIGIRMALGSTTRGVVELVLREGILLVAGGAVLGLAGAWLLRGVLATQLYGLDAMDPVVVGSAVAMLCTLALAACLAPARRAARLHPADVLNP